MIVWNSHATHHPLADNDVYVLDRQLNLFDLALNDTERTEMVIRHVCIAGSLSTYVMTSSNPLFLMFCLALLANPEASMA
jgi:hypothetical protein